MDWGRVEFVFLLREIRVLCTAQRNCSAVHRILIIVKYEISRKGILFKLAKVIVQDV